MLPHHIQTVSRRRVGDVNPHQAQMSAVEALSIGQEGDTAHRGHSERQCRSIQCIIAVGDGNHFLTWCDSLKCTCPCQPQLD